MGKINQEEYEVLKGLDGNLKMLGRNSFGWLIATRENPIKGEETWNHVENKKTFTQHQDSLFQFIQWEDESPYNIQELIEEYEYWQRLAQNPTVANLVGYRNESEETEVKDNKLNRKTLDKILTEYFDETALSDDDAKIILDYHNFDDETLIELALGVVGLAWGTSGRKVVDILDDFDKLDEPETLSEYWIEQKSIDTHVDTLSGEVQVTFRLDDLQNLLVPKRELPVIPKFVADVLEKNKRDNFKLIDTYSILIKRGFDMDRLVQDWLREDWTREDIFARAWIDGYTVEEEQKYYVLFGNQPHDDNWTYALTNSGSIEIFEKDVLPEWDRIKFTEQEIKDYDERYWPFAVKVEELEE